MKLFKKIIIILMIFSFINVKAYENDIFKIDIPEDYKLDESQKDNTYKWSKNNNYFSVAIVNNNSKNYNVDKFTEEDIKNQKEYIENAISEGLSKYKITVTVSDARKVKTNNVSALEYDIYYPTKSLLGYDMYQKERLYTTQKYIITTVYNNDGEIKEDSEYYKIIDSLEILDNQIDTSTKKESIINKFIPAIIIGVILAILGFIRDNLKKRNS